MELALNMFFGLNLIKCSFHNSVIELLVTRIGADRTPILKRIIMNFISLPQLSLLAWQSFSP